MPLSKEMPLSHVEYYKLVRWITKRLLKENRRYPSLGLGERELEDMVSIAVSTTYFNHSNGVHDCPLSPRLLRSARRIERDFRNTFDEQVKELAAARPKSVRAAGRRHATNRRDKQAVIAYIAEHFPECPRPR